MGVDLRDVLALLHALEWACDGSLGFYCPSCGASSRMVYDRETSSHFHHGSHHVGCELKAMMEKIEQEMV